MNNQLPTSYVSWLREHVGSRKVFLPFVTVIVEDAHGRILLQRRTDFSFWGLPGGVLELTEDVQAGARRELAEETGLTAGRLRLVGIYTDPRYDLVYPNGDQVQQFTFCLAGKVNGGRMQADGVETTFQQFVDPADLFAYDLPPWYRDMLYDYLRGGAPTFRIPFRRTTTFDQIATVRPYIGDALYAGMGVAAVVRQKDRVLMLHHRGETHWRLPSGFSDLGENAAWTAVREIWEETRLQIVPQRVLGVNADPALNSRYANGDQVHNVGVVFEAHLLGGRPKLDQQEILDMAWVQQRELPDMVTPERRPFYAHILAALEEGAFIY